jgi:hypothetical protein
LTKVQYNIIIRLFSTGHIHLLSAENNNSS